MDQSEQYDVRAHRRADERKIGEAAGDPGKEGRREIVSGNAPEVEKAEQRGNDDIDREHCQNRGPAGKLVQKRVGVKKLPSETPSTGCRISRNMVGTCTFATNCDATMQMISEPSIHGMGMPSRLKIAPPTAAMASVFRVAKAFCITVLKLKRCHENTAGKRAANYRSANFVSSSAICCGVSSRMFAPRKMMASFAVSSSSSAA